MVLSAGCGQDASALEVEDLDVPEDVVARVVFFRADDCAVCSALYDEVIAPLQNRCGPGLELKLVDVAEPEGYEAFVATERALIGEAGRWEIPTVVVGETYFIGDSAIRQELLPHLSCVLGAGGNAWPAVDELGEIAAAPTTETADLSSFNAGDSVEGCVDDEESAICESGEPIFVLYFAAADCDDVCDRTRYDLRYLQGVYPQMFFEERDIADNQVLAEALAERAGVATPGPLAPAVVVGDDYLAGDALTLDHLRDTVGSYSESGATAIWYTLDIP
jgi:hypothetical protein